MVSSHHKVVSGHKSVQSWSIKSTQKLYLPTFSFGGRPNICYFVSYVTTLFSLDDHTVVPRFKVRVVYRKSSVPLAVVHIREPILCAPIPQKLLKWSPKSRKTQKVHFLYRNFIGQYSLYYH